jgi:hypothetical protein
MKRLGDFGQLDLDGLHAGSKFQTPAGRGSRFFQEKKSEAEPAYSLQNEHVPTLRQERHSRQSHTRLFTFCSVRELLKQSGYKILETRGIPAPSPVALGNTFIARALLWLNAALVHMSKGLFSYPDFHSGGRETDGALFCCAKRSLAATH